MFHQKILPFLAYSHGSTLIIHEHVRVSHPPLSVARRARGLEKRKEEAEEPRVI